MAPPRLGRVEDVSAITTLTPAALRRQILEGRDLGALSFKVGGARVWDLDEVAAWLEAQRDIGRARFAARARAVQ